MNIVILSGRLCADPEIRTSTTGMTIANYRLAVNRMKRKGEEDKADFLNCVAFDKKAEFAERYLFKGTKINLRGHIQTGSYVNREGQKVYTTDIIVDEQEFAESKGVQQEAPPSVPDEAMAEFTKIDEGTQVKLPF